MIAVGPHLRGNAKLPPARDHRGAPAKKSPGAPLVPNPVDKTPGFLPPTPTTTNRRPVEVPPGLLPPTGPVDKNSGVLNTNNGPVDNLPGPPADTIPARPSSLNGACLPPAVDSTRHGGTLKPLLRRRRAVKPRSGNGNARKGPPSKINPAAADEDVEMAPPPIPRRTLFFCLFFLYIYSSFFLQIILSKVPSGYRFPHFSPS